MSDSTNELIERAVEKIMFKKINTVMKDQQSVISIGEVIEIDRAGKRARVFIFGTSNVSSFIPFATNISEADIGVGQTCIIASPDPRIPDAQFILAVYKNFTGIGSNWLFWEPTYAASGSMTYTSVTTNLARYRNTGKEVHFTISATGTVGGTLSNSLSFTLPLPPAFNSFLDQTFMAVIQEGGGARSIGYGTVQAEDGTVFVRKDGEGNFSSGTGRDITVTGTYEI